MKLDLSGVDYRNKHLDYEHWTNRNKNRNDT